MNVTSASTPQNYETEKSPKEKPTTENTPVQLTGMKKDIALAILNDYNPLDLTQEDVQKIAAQFQAASIYPSEELATILSDNGFNSRGLGEALGTVGLSGSPSQEVTSAETAQNNNRNDENSFASMLDNMMDKKEGDKKNKSFY